jgi:hypothetical protein
MRFQDILVIQILGEISRSTFSGLMRLNVGGQALQLIIKQGQLVHIRHPKASLNGYDALEDCAWYSEGDFVLETMPLPINRTIEYTEMLKQLIKMRIQKDPFPLAVSDKQRLATFLLSTDKANHAEIDKLLGSFLPHPFLELKKGLSVNALPPMDANTAKRFWQMLYFLTGLGQVRMIYHPVFLPLLTSLEHAISQRMQKLLGANIMQNYQKKVAAELEGYPVDDEGRFPAEAGLSPYSTWYTALRTQVTQVGVPSMAKKAFEDGYNSLNSQEKSLFSYL